MWAVGDVGGLKQQLTAAVTARSGCPFSPLPLLAPYPMPPDYNSASYGYCALLMNAVNCDIGAGLP